MLRRSPLLFLVTALVLRLVCADTLMVYGRLPSHPFRMGIYEIERPEYLEEFDPDTFFLDSAQEVFTVVQDGDHDEQEVMGPLVPIEYEPFMGAEEWGGRSSDLILGMDACHIRVLGSYISSLLLTSSTGEDTGYFLETQEELEHVLSLCLPNGGLDYSATNWYIGWIVPHVPTYLLRELPSATKSAIMNTLMIGDEPQGAQVSPPEHARLRKILDVEYTDDNSDEVVSDEVADCHYEIHTTSSSSTQISGQLPPAYSPQANMQMRKDTGGTLASSTLSYGFSEATLKRIKAIQKIRQERLNRHKQAAEQDYVLEEVVEEVSGTEEEEEVVIAPEKVDRKAKRADRVKREHRNPKKQKRRLTASGLKRFDKQKRKQPEEAKSERGMLPSGPTYRVAFEELLMHLL